MQYIKSVTNESRKRRSDVGFLIPTHRRTKYLERILDISFQNGIKHFFIFSDAPSSAKDLENTPHQSSIINMIKNWNNRNPTARINWAIAKKNFGCSGSILRGLDWISSKTNKFIVMEDDCVPSSDFFDFSDDSFKKLESEFEPWLFCGSQFAPVEITENNWSLSKYSLTWGWGTTSKKWQEIRSAIINLNITSKSSSLYRDMSEKRYWESGRRRATLGYIDVWDILISDALLRNGRFAILPGVNLVSNLGADDFATHTLQIHPFHDLPVGTYKKTINLLPNNPLDEWLRRRLYGISRKHLITTRITHLIDRLQFNNKKVDSLDKRWLAKTHFIDYNYKY